MITDEQCKKMIQQLRLLEPGQRLNYHIGLLIDDKAIDKKLNAIWRETRRLQAMGHIHLFQRKLDIDGIYCYIAVGKKGAHHAAYARDEAIPAGVDHSTVF